MEKIFEKKKRIQSNKTTLSQLNIFFGVYNWIVFKCKLNKTASCYSDSLSIIKWGCEFTE